MEKYLCTCLSEFSPWLLVFAIVKITLSGFNHLSNIARLYQGACFTVYNKFGKNSHCCCHHWHTTSHCLQRHQSEAFPSLWSKEQKQCFVPTGDFVYRGFTGKRDAIFQSGNLFLFFQLLRELTVGLCCASHHNGACLRVTGQQLDHCIDNIGVRLFANTSKTAKTNRPGILCFFLSAVTPVAGEKSSSGIPCNMIVLGTSRYLEVAIT